MKVVIPGGSGQIGQILVRHLSSGGHDVVVLSRGADSCGTRTVQWDGRSPGEWQNEIDGADVVINLAGRSVNCRYSKRNLEQMMSSRVDSTRAVGRAIATAARPPAIWLQMSTATIYAHRFDAANDEASGVIGGSEPDVPRYWDFSIEIAKAWERAQQDVPVPGTRKVALRTAMVMSPDRGGVFDMLCRLTRLGLGGTIGGGRQYVSFIHQRDFCRAIELLIERDDLGGPINLACPNPLRQSEQMRLLRRALGVRVGLPATRWMARIGALFLRTDTELVLKSRRVVPERLLQAGFRFEFPDWASTVADLTRQAQRSVSPGGIELHSDSHEPA